MKNVKQIVRQYLNEIGADGLIGQFADEECACDKSELFASCHFACEFCVPAVKITNGVYVECYGETYVKMKGPKK